MSVTTCSSLLEFLSLWHGLLPYLRDNLGIGGEIYAKSWPFVIVGINQTGQLFQLLVIWITVLLAINRYIAVCYPLQAAKWCTLSKAKLQTTVVFIFVIIFYLPTYFQYQIDHKIIINPITGQNETAVCVKPNKFWDLTLFDLIHNTILCSIFVHILPLFCS